MRFAVIGAGGHSREVADLVVACGHTVAGFADEYAEGVHHPTGIPIVADWTVIDADAMTIAIGAPRVRAELYKQVARAMPFWSLVHPSACVSLFARVGDGVQVMQNAVVSASATVEDNVILNVGCFVAHDCTVGSHSHVGPGALMSGGSSVGEQCTVGAGAIILPGVAVGAECTIGAGAVVTHDVPSQEVVAGVPARSRRVDS